MIDATTEIEELVAFKPRGAGSDAERRAANHLRARLESLGRDATVEQLWMRPNWPLAHALHAALGVVASVLSIASPLTGAIVALLVLVSAIGDATGWFHIARRAFGRRASQNVISREDGGRPGTLVLVAHYDAARTGFAYGRLAWVARRMNPFGLLIGALVLVLATSLARAAGSHAAAVEVVQFAATVALIVAVPLLIDIALSDVVPGASDNASGVATALRLAERYGDGLEHFDVWVLFPGAQEALQEGMRGWLKRHKRELDPRRTVFLGIDNVGAGTVRYTRGFHPRLVTLCEQIAAEDADEGRYRAAGIRQRAPSDALAARRAGFPAISISCRGDRDLPDHLHLHSDTAENVDAAALDRAYRFCSELIELVDDLIGPDVADVHRAQAARVSG